MKRSTGDSLILLGVLMGTATVTALVTIQIMKKKIQKQCLEVVAQRCTEGIQQIPFGERVLGAEFCPSMADDMCEV